MGVATGCGFKEIYRFPHTTYPYPLVSVLFGSSIPTSVFILLNIYIYLYPWAVHLVPRGPPVNAQRTNVRPAE